MRASFRTATKLALASQGFVRPGQLRNPLKAHVFSFRHAIAATDAFSNTGRPSAVKSKEMQRVNDGLLRVSEAIVGTSVASGRRRSKRLVAAAQFAERGKHNFAATRLKQRLPACASIWPSCGFPPRHVDMPSLCCKLTAHNDKTRCSSGDERPTWLLTAPRRHLYIVSHLFSATGHLKAKRCRI